MYTMTCMRSDVTYSLRVVSRYQSDRDENYWKVMKITLRYLRNTKDQYFIYEDTDMKLVEYTDSSFQSDSDDSRNVSDYICILNGGAVCWKSFKQYTVADSVCEVKYITASDAAKEAVWLKKFITELGLHLLLMTPSCCIMTVPEP